VEETSLIDFLEIKDSDKQWPTEDVHFSPFKSKANYNKLVRKLRKKKKKFKSQNKNPLDLTNNWAKCMNLLTQ